MFADANGITWKCKLKSEQVYLFNFQQYFGYIIAVSFIGGGNRRTKREPPTGTANFYQLPDERISISSLGRLCVACACPCCCRALCARYYLHIQLYYTVIIWLFYLFVLGPSWSYGSWIYNYRCNQCISSLMVWVGFGRIHSGMSWCASS
jgi:hypothetical protein